MKTIKVGEKPPKINSVEIMFRKLQKLGKQAAKYPGVFGGLFYRKMNSMF